MIDFSTTIDGFQDKKIRAKYVAQSYARMGLTYQCGPVLREESRVDYYKKSALINGCGTLLDFTVDTGELYRANFCKQRLCPMCMWRRSLKLFGNLSRILDAYDAQDGDHQYLFFTATIANVPGEQLGQAIDTLLQGHRNMVNNRAWKNRVRGCYRGLEITYNAETQMYHPHLHYIVAVSGTYGQKTDKDYWNHEDWLQIWKTSAGLDYRPSVRIHRVRDRDDGKNGQAAAIAEVAKYVVKDDGLGAYKTTMEYDRTVDVLTRYLKGRRLISYNGIFSKIRKQLRLEDEETGDLTDGVIRSDLFVLVRRYSWYSGAYHGKTILRYNDNSGCVLQGMAQEHQQAERDYRTNRRLEILARAEKQR